MHLEIGCYDLVGKIESFHDLTSWAPIPTYLNKAFIVTVV